MSVRPLVVAASLLWFSLAASSALASYTQQGAKLVGTGGVGQTGQGFSVAVSADGKTAIVGGYMDDFYIGAAWVYTRSAGVWSQQGAKLVGAGGVGQSHLGYSVAVSADGNTAVVGGKGDNDFVGAAWVYTRSGGIWSQQGIRLVGSGAVGNASQGTAVAVSADGNTAVVGGSNDDSGAGAVWVFRRIGVGWYQQGAKLVGTGAVGGAQQGLSVAVSAAGNTIVVGGFSDNNALGATWIFVRNGNAWSQQGPKLVGTDAVGEVYQGFSVAVSADGNTAVVGGNADNGQTGAAWVYTRSSGVWSQQGTKLVGTGAAGNAQQGYSVATSADGNTAIVGGWLDNSGAGALWVYTRSAGVWNQQGTKLVGTGAVGRAVQGWSVALSADANTAVVGGYEDNAFIGAAWVFAIQSPKFADIGDVPNDQGGRVSLRWTASPLDIAPGNPIDRYWIWRQVPIQTAILALADGATLVREGTAAVMPNGRTFRTTIEAAQVYYWEYVGIQVAHGLPGYSYTASTLSDSVPGSNPYTLFMVEAERLSTGEYWSSDPDSGYSVDNLPPGPPAPVSAEYSVGATHIQWVASTETDFVMYRLYRGATAGFVPGPGNLVTTQPNTGYADVGPAGSYYKLSAVDVHSNESSFSLVTPGTTLSAGDDGSVAFGLEGVRPNPARGSGFNVAFALPTSATARLELLDMSGRRVLSREVGSLGAGRHTVSLAEGRKVAPGLYWVRLAQGTNRREARVAVIE